MSGPVVFRIDKSKDSKASTPYLLGFLAFDETKKCFTKLSSARTTPQVIQAWTLQGFPRYLFLGLHKVSLLA